eukprot:m.295984 g.295984  ORF g.295984 m.295984 type:complete len:3942 (+) comp19518_c0_seq1:299-12124(+)
MLAMAKSSQNSRSSPTTTTITMRTLAVAVVAMATLLPTVTLAGKGKGAIITGVTPIYGSMEGNTRITIQGSGFARDGLEGRTDVYVGNELCTVDEYNSNDNALVCYTAPYSENVTTADITMPVQVAVVSVDRATLAKCSGYCSFRYVQSRTPVVSSLSSGTTPGSLVKISGYLRGEYAREYTVKIGGKHCPLTTDSDEQILGSWNWYGSLTCETPDLAAGRYNVTLNVDEERGWGDARFDWDLQRAHGASKHLITVHPSISSVSTKVSGDNGGQTVVIHGSGFDDSATCAGNTVHLAGVPCNVVSCSNSKLECAAGPASQVGSATGGSRGIIAKIWHPLESWTSSAFNDAYDSPTITAVVGTGMQGYDRDFMEKYTQELDGWFVPPFSGNFTFYIRSDDHSQLQLSSDQHAENLTRIAWANRYLEGYFTGRNDAGAKQISDPIHLSEGDRYRIRAHMVEGGGGDFIYVAVRGAPDTPSIRSALELEYHSVTEKQEVSISSSIVRAKHTLTITGASEGTFTVTANQRFSEQVVDLSSSPNTKLKNALREVYTDICRSITVSNVKDGDSKWTFTITYNCPSAQEYPLFQVRNDNMPRGYRSSVARVASPSEPVRGTLKLAVDNQWTPSFDYDASATHVKRLLEALTVVDHVDVEDGGNAHDGKNWLVYFRAPHGNIPLIHVDDSALTGADVATEVTVFEHGSNDAFWDPIPGDFLEVADDEPQVLVDTNGFRAACATPYGCRFAYNSTVTPSVTGISAAGKDVGAGDAVLVGDVLTIDGTLFPENATQVSVWIGNDGNCEVSATSATQIQCTVGDATTGSYAIRVVSAATGLASVGGAVPNITYGFTVDTVSRSEGGVLGGETLTLNGTGFSTVLTDNGISVGGQACVVTAASVSHVSCTVPAMASIPATHPGSGTSNETISVGLFGNLNLDTPWTYDWELTPSLTAITSTSQVSSGLTTQFRFSGDFATFSAALVDASCAASVMFGTRACVGVEVTDSEVSCLLPRDDPLPAAQQPGQAPTFSLCGSNGWVRGHVASGVQADLALRVTAISTLEGSMQGGTTIVITGAGFHTRTSLVSVEINDPVKKGRTMYCDVDATAFGSITCTTAPLADGGNITGPLNVHINGIQAVCDVAGGCEFAALPATTPTVGSVSPDSGVTPKAIAITGTGFAGTASVEVGGHACGSPTVVSATQITCTVPAMVSAGKNTIKVTTGHGTAAHANASAPVVFAAGLELDAIVPATLRTGSVAGGATVTITGAGFSSMAVDNTVLFGSTQAVVVSATPTAIEVVVPDSHSSSSSSSGITVSVAAPSMHHGDGDDDDGEDAMGMAMMPTVATTDDCPFPANCTYRYSSDVTPRTDSVSPSSSASAASPLFKGDVITLTGANLKQSAASVEVTVGGAACAINASTHTDAVIECALGDSPAGAHLVIVNLAGIGVADMHRTVHTGVEVTAVASGASYAGGTLVTLTGRGFATHGAASGAAGPGPGASVSTVAWAGRDCVVTSSSYTQLTCAAPALQTVSSLAAVGRTTEPGVLLSGTPSGGFANAFDDDVETYVSGSRNDCVIDYDFGPANLAYVTRVRYQPRLKYASRMARGKFQGCNADASACVDLGSVVNPFQGWSYFDVPAEDNHPAFAKLRYVGGTDSYCQVASLEYVGHLVADPAVSDAGSDAFNATVTITSAPHPSLGATAVAGTTAKAVTTASSQLVTYASTAGTTPVVTGVSPRSGSSLGGTVVTITGTGLPTSTGTGSVSLNGVACALLTASATELRCLTAPRPSGSVAPESLAVTHTDTGSAALVGADVALFRYLDSWSRPNTWAGDELPIAGDSVVVPKGQTVLLDVSPPCLFLVLVQGRLVFDRKDIDFCAHYILVQGGTLEVGTEEEPFLQRAVITLRGDKYDDVEIPHIGSKVLAVQDATFTHHDHGAGHHVAEADRGTLDVHGRPRMRVWTKVAQTAEAGDTELVVSEPVDYETGDQLVLTSSSISMYETEEVEVVARSADNLTLTLSAPLKYRHESSFYEHDGEVVDMRIEVGLLSRNVVIQGDEASKEQNFGVHTIAAHGGTYRIENTEVRNCGQMGNLGRYCVHYHMANEQSHSYVRSNSIHHSFQRAVVTHGSHRVRIERNVAYHVHGHTYFVEDGIEEDNVFEENLGVFTLKSFALLESDTKPATFWTSTPTNFWRHNVAAGCENDGYWFELPGNPGGPSFTEDECPVHGHLRGFYNNTAHANGVHGLRIYPQWTPLVQPCGASSEPAPQFLRNFTSFHNGGHGIFTKKGGDLHHVNAKLVENGDEELLWFKLLSVRYYNDSDLANVIDLLAVGSRDPGAPASGRGLMCPQEEFFFVSGGTFVNYASGVISGCASCDSDQFLKQGGYTFRFERLAFDNSPVRVEWTPPYKQIFHDLDGTLTGAGPFSTATPYYAYNDWPECPRAGAMLGEGTVCDGRVRIRRVQMDGVDPEELDRKTLRIISSAGNDTVGFRPKELYGWVASVVTHHEYRYDYDGSDIDFQWMKLRYSEPDYVLDQAAQLAGHASGPDPEWQRALFDYIDYRYAYDLWYRDDQDLVLPKVGELQALTKDLDFGTSQHSVTDQQLRVLFSASGADPYAVGSGDFGAGRGPFSLRVRAVQCAPDGCLLRGDEPLRAPQYWSQADTWDEAPFNGNAPAAGEDLVIPGGKYVLLDVALPGKFKSCVIEGKLEFVDTMDYTLECDSLVVWGVLQIGSKPVPFAHNALIRLYGNRFSRTTVVHNDVFAGNKVLVVLGSAQLFGVERIVTWTKLDATADVGATQLTLVDPVDWAVGEEIALTGTEYDADQMETVTITAVSGDGLTVDFAPALSYRHFAGVVLDDTGGGGEVTLRGAVGLLSRNVVIEGHRTSDTDTYGAHVIVADAEFGEPNPGIKRGRSSFHGVEFRHCGKQNSEHPCLEYNYRQAMSADNFPANSVKQAAFSHSLNNALRSLGSYGLKIEDSVMHRTFRSAVFLDENTNEVLVTGNLVVGNYRSPDETDPTWHAPFAGFFVDTDSVTSFANNVVGSADDLGFALRLSPCAATQADEVFVDNEAHGAVVGAFLLSHSGDCLSLSGLVAWKNSHLGVVTVDQLSNLLLDRVVLSDNHIGISLNFHRFHLTDNRAELTNSHVLGSTAASGSGCAHSVDCRASAKADVFSASCQSVFGSGYRRVGVVLSQYLNRVKTCDRAGLPVCRPPNLPERMCSMPWEKRYGLPAAVHGKLVLSSVTFGHFSESDCGLKSLAISTNPSQPDYSPPIHASGIAWRDVDHAAKLNLGKTDRHLSECDGSCDALTHAYLHDLDGTLSGTEAGAVYVSTKNPMISPGALCDLQANQSAYLCSGAMHLWEASLENKDRDRGDRRIGPVKLTYEEDNTNDTRVYWSSGNTFDGCPIEMPFGQFPFSLRHGMEYDMELQGTVPANTRIHWFSPNPSDRVLLRLFVSKPLKVQVFAGGARVNALTDGYPTLADPRGTHVFDSQNRTLYLVLGGASDGIFHYDLRTEQVVQLTMSFAMPLDEFNGERLLSNLATLLGIPKRRIKIVDVHRVEDPTKLELAAATRRRRAAGDEATQAVVEISPEDDLSSDQEEVDQQIDELNSLFDDVEGLATDGTLKATLEQSGLPLVALAAKQPDGNGANTAAVQMSVDPPTSEPLGGAAGIAGVVVGGLALVALLVVAVMYHNKHTNRRRASAVSPMRSKHAEGGDDFDAGTDADSKHSRRGSPSAGVLLTREQTQASAAGFAGVMQPGYGFPEVADTPYQQASVSGDKLHKPPPSVKDRIHALQSVKVKVNLQRTWEYVPGELWFHPTVTPAQADEFLAKKADNAFVVYGREQLLLAVKHNNQVYHHRIIEEGDLLYLRPRPTGEEAAATTAPIEPASTHPDLAGLISHYTTPQPDVDFVLLTPEFNPVMKPFAAVATDDVWRRMSCRASRRTKASLDSFQATTLANHDI